jgi:hypothetical protein
MTAGGKNLPIKMIQYYHIYVLKINWRETYNIDVRRTIALLKP